MKGSGSISYTFNDSEIKCLSRLLRLENVCTDSNLDIFRCFLDKYIYDIMTIEEAEKFFNEQNINFS